MISAQRDLGGSEDFARMVEELGQRFVIRHLAISRQQLTAWLRPNSRVPRGQVLALYWECQWGRSVVDTHREFEARNLRALADAHQRVADRLAERVRQLERELRDALDQRSSVLPVAANDRWIDDTASGQRAKRPVRSIEGEFMR